MTQSVTRLLHAGFHRCDSDFNGLAASSLREKLANFVIACLGEIFVPLTDGIEVFRHDYRSDIIRCAADFVIDLIPRSRAPRLQC